MKEPNSRNVSDFTPIRRETLATRPKRKGERPSVAGIVELTLVIEGVTRAGGLITLRQSGDGGVLLITVFHGDTKLTCDCHTRGDLLAALDALAKEYEETIPSNGA